MKSALLSPLGYKVTMVVAVCYALLSASIVAAQSASQVTIYDSGVVEVHITSELEAGVNGIPLPVEPIEYTIVAKIDGAEIPTAYEDGVLYVASSQPATVDVSYIANVSSKNGLLRFEVGEGYVVDVVVYPQVLLLSWPEENVLNVSMEGDRMILEVKGPVAIEYTLKAPAQAAPGQPSEQPTGEQPVVTAWTNNLLYIAVVVVIAVVVALAFKIRRRRSVKSEESLISVLSDSDTLIIEFLRSKGGSAFQSEMQEALQMSKTTLWKHVKKLEKLGVVKVEKIAGQNRVTLLERFRR